jgi:hypothetical protein
MLSSQPDVSLLSLKLVVQRACDVRRHKYARTEPEQSLRTPGVSLCTINVDPFRPLICPSSSSLIGICLSYAFGQAPEVSDVPQVNLPLL